MNVSWTTASEINNDYFTVERSVNGNEWEIIQRVIGAGNSTNYLSYQFRDVNPRNGISFYRLRQTDYDGIEKVFPPQQVKLNFGEKYAIYPNPASDYVYVKSTEEIDFRVSCFNSIGQKIAVNDIVAGQTSILTISDLPDGVYFISIEQYGLIVKTEAVLVQHR
ncbi:MAG: T9SS type A sorting domain-containing protein [Bacteroidetes bacterium]|nr:T9SS type A sorting domain-containing protein [Bacteroidota bacterium]